ncbi:MAG: hypothetical protein KBT69_09595 [Oceanihabitans sp.]|nr:hypothetical protein [Oceanihabitans sp.]
MKKWMLIMLLVTASANAQHCFARLQEAFETRGSYAVADDMHRNVYIVYFQDGDSRCVSGKARVVNSKIVSIFLQYEDDTYELLALKFFNAAKLPPTISNGISEMIYTTDSEKFKIVFIDPLKPKRE